MLLRSVIFLLVLVLLGVTYGSGQDENETIKVETELISVPVVVSDRAGKPLPRLKAKDFTLLRDGVPQKIEFFAAVDEPLQIAFLVDTSDGAAGWLPNIKASLRSVIRSLRPQDRVVVNAFDESIHMLSDMTADRPRLNLALDWIKASSTGGQSTRQALYQTVHGTLGTIRGRKAVILVTTGTDKGSPTQPEQLIRWLRESDAIIYTVKIGAGENVGSQPEAFLRQVSDTTGGLFHASPDGRFGGTLLTIINELRSQYRLGFYPPEEPGTKREHTLNVKVSRSGAKTRHRTSYKLPDR